LIESKRGNGIRDIATDAWQFANCSGVTRQNPTVLVPYDPGSGMKISRAVVIAESLPGVEHIILRSPGNRGEIRKSAQPFIVIGDHSTDLGLLKHELGDKDRVRVAGIAPRQVPSIPAKPLQERTAKRIDV
jgi:hypothetical protein